MKFVLLSLITSLAFAANVDLKASQLKWAGSKVVGDVHYGSINLSDANITMKDGVPTAGSFTIDMDTIKVEDIKGQWATKFEGHMKNEDFFQVGTYPTSKFVITSSDANMITGNLTIKDKTKKISFPYTVSGNTINAKIKFDRTRFGVKYASRGFIASLVSNIGDKVIKDIIDMDVKLVVK